MSGTGSERRVLFFTLGLDLSGQSIHIANLARGLQRLSWETEIVAGDLAFGKPLGAEFFEARGIAAIEAPVRGWSPGPRYIFDQALAAVAFRRIVKVIDPTVIHLHSATLAPLAWYASRSNSVRRAIVTTLNNERIAGRKLQLARAATRVWPYFLGDRVVTISKEMEVLALRDIGVRPDLVRRIDYALDDEYFRPPTSIERLEARKRFALSPMDRAVGCVGRLEPRKNQVVLIRALAALNETKRPYRLLLAGTDVAGYQTILEDLATSLGVRELVQFLGFTDPREVYWASDVNVLPSIEEGFGLAVIEGMVCGVPTIRSASTAGAADQIEHGRNGFLVNPQSVPDVVDMIRKALGRTDISEAAVEFVLSRFTIDRMADQVSTIYERAAQSRNC